MQNKMKERERETIYIMTLDIFCVLASNKKKKLSTNICNPIYCILNMNKQKQKYLLDENVVWVCVCVCQLIENYRTKFVTHIPPFADVTQDAPE